MHICIKHNVIPYQHSQFLCQLDKQFLKKRGGGRGRAENVVCYREVQAHGQKSVLNLGLLMLPVHSSHFIS